MLGSGERCGCLGNGSDDRRDRLLHVSIDGMNYLELKSSNNLILRASNML